MPTGEPAGSSLNVGLFGRPIKGKGQHWTQFVAAVLRRPLFLEKLIRGRAVGRDCLHMRLDPGDFALQRSDPRVQLILRERPEVLLHEQGQRVLRLAGKEVVLVHGLNR